MEHIWVYDDSKASHIWYLLKLLFPRPWTDRHKNCKVPADCAVCTWLGITWCNRVVIDLFVETFRIFASISCLGDTIGTQWNPLFRLCILSLGQRTLIFVSYSLLLLVGWSTVVIGINSASNTVRKCKIARGEAKCLLPDCIASAINPNYHSRPSYYKIILHPTFTVGFL